MDDLQYYQSVEYGKRSRLVLNLVINGWPSIHPDYPLFYAYSEVLNLVINGWPSIPNSLGCSVIAIFRF